MFFKLIRKNGKDSYKENGIYFLSLVIVIIAFYVILSLEKQDVMMFLKEMESDAVGRLFLMIKGVYGISLFMIFFMVYFAQRYQLQRRNHEFGMLMMLGMPRGRLFGMLMIEDLYTSAVSLICGLPIAIVLSECISLITAKLVGMGIIGHHFSLSPTAIGVTAIGFFVIKLVANLILSAKIVRKEPGVLMREQVEQTYKNVKWVREILGIVVGCGCLIAAYGIVLTSGIVFYQLKWMAIICMAYGISVSVSQAHKYEHGMDYTFVAYAVHKDYVMEMVSLEEVCEDVVEEYTEYVDAQSIEWRVQVGKEQVLTDRKGLHFMLEQILNNACKYKDTGKETSYIEMTTVVEENRIWLQIKDNGFGAEEAEIPFLPDKGFTGKTGMGQAKATGMGLYLVAQMAKDLSLCVDIESKVGASFIIRIGFPVISR